MSKALIIKHGGIEYIPNQPLGDITYTAGYTSQSNGDSSSPCVGFRGEKYSLAQLWGGGSNIEAWFVGNNHSNFLYSTDAGATWNERVLTWSTGNQGVPSANINYFSEARSQTRNLRYKTNVGDDYINVGNYTPTTTQNLSVWYSDFLKASLIDSASTIGYIRYREPDSEYITVTVHICVMPYTSGNGFVVLAGDSSNESSIRRNIFVPIENNTCWSASPVYVGQTDSSGNSQLEFIIQTGDGKLYLYAFSLTSNSATSITQIKDANDNEVVVADVIKNWGRTGRNWYCGAYTTNNFSGYWYITGSNATATYTALAKPITGSSAVYAFRSFKRMTYIIASGTMGYYIYSDGRYIYTPAQSTALVDMRSITDSTNEPLNSDREFQFYNYYTYQTGGYLICMSEQKIIRIAYPSGNLAGYTSAAPVWIDDCPIIKIGYFGNSSFTTINGIDAAGRLLVFTANGWTYSTSSSGIDTTVTSQFAYDDAYNISACNNSTIGLGWFFTKNKTAYWTNTNGATNSAEATSSYTVTDVDVDTVSNKILALARDSYILFNRNSAMPYHIDFNIPTTVTSADTTLKRYVQLGTTHVFAYAALNTDISEGQRYVLWTKADLASYTIFQPLSDFKFETNKITAVKDIYVWNNYVIIHGSSAVKQHVWYKVWRSTEDNTWKHREITCDMPYDEVLEPCVTNDYIVFVGKTTHKIYFTNLMNSSSYTYQLSSNDSSIIGIVETSSNNFTVFESNGSYGYLEFELAQ